MWQKLKPALPHAAILLANMFNVLFLIDRVNTSMNFIDNRLTKGLLVFMGLVAIVNWRGEAARARRRRAKSKKAVHGGLSGLLPPLGAALGAACLLGVLLDALFPAWSLFLMEWFKLFLFAACLTVIAASLAVAHGDRKRLRRRLARQKQRQKG